eukprot:GHUV01031079.1.p1 GENE.GHUV01031079.1~~GHUV01031079.1.p1  ORF type:complete len:241 (+),score=75.72 GHUV01031079.1:946-1668(+)
MGNPNGLTAPLIAALMQISINAQAANGGTSSPSTAGGDTSSSSAGTVTPVIAQFQQASGLDVDPAALMNIPRNAATAAQAANQGRRTMTTGTDPTQAGLKGAPQLRNDTEVFKATEASDNNSNNSGVKGKVPGNKTPNTTDSGSKTLVHGESAPNTQAIKHSAGVDTQPQSAYGPPLSCDTSSKSGKGMCSTDEPQETKQQSKDTTASATSTNDIVFLEVPDSKLGAGTATTDNTEKAKV